MSRQQFKENIYLSAFACRAINLAVKACKKIKFCFTDLGDDFGSSESSSEGGKIMFNEGCSGLKTKL